MTNLIKYFLVFILFGLASCSSEANNMDKFPPIIAVYKNLVSMYDKKISEGDFKSAYLSAKELLNIDPSDTTSYLRLAIAA